MNTESSKRHFVEAMAKHLPPSSANLRLLDIDGQSGDILAQRRHDLDIQIVPSKGVETWTLAEGSVDAVVAYNIALDTSLLNRVLQVMRAGGRLTIVLPAGQVTSDYVDLLETHGYVRILVEPAVDNLGVLIRGEKAHTTDDTLQRIQQVATADGDMLDLATFKGRYVHLLIRQTPNKPVWKLQPDEQIRWQAVAIRRDDVILLGFSSLPKAVGFMQPAVMENVIQDINKVGKFSKDTASTWSWSVLLNPTLDMIRDEALTWVEIDPITAEASDE